MQFVNPKNDVAFKKIFGSEQNHAILISFLNAVLDLTGARAIQTIQLLNPYQTPTIDSLKYTLLDIKATDGRGVTFIIEMQVEYVPSFLKRFLYYTSKAYVAQIERGEDYPRLNQVIFIGILDFVAFAGEAYLTRHTFRNEQTGKQEITDLELNFIELPKFTKREAEVETVLDQWLYFITNASDLEVIPASVDVPPVRSAYEAANRFGWSADDMEMYLNRGIKIQDERGALQAAEERGEARGRATGQEAAQAAIVGNMLAQGMERAQIALLTGLSEAQVAALAADGA